MEPLAVAVYACKRANITEGAGQKVMVTGAWLPVSNRIFIGMEIILQL